MEIGFEVICCCVKCEHNDSPVCGIHTMNNPIRLGAGGMCVNYDERKDAQ